MSRRFILAALAALLLPGALERALAADARITTFDEAVRIALEQNSDLKQAEITAKGDEVAVAQARGRFYPDLSLSARGSQNFGRNFNEEEGRVIDTKTRTASLGL